MTIVSALGSAACSASRLSASQLAIVAPDRFLHRCDSLELGSRAHLAQPYTIREQRLARHGVHGRDHHRLGLLGHEARRKQARGEVGR